MFIISLSQTLCLEDFGSTLAMHYWKRKQSVTGHFENKMECVSKLETTVRCAWAGISQESAKTQ